MNKTPLIAYNFHLSPIIFVFNQERELEARTIALRTSQGVENYSSNNRNFDDRNDPPSGCGGGGGGMEQPRLVF